MNHVNLCRFDAPCRHQSLQILAGHNHRVHGANLPRPRPLLPTNSRIARVALKFVYADFRWNPALAYAALPSLIAHDFDDARQSARTPKRQVNRLCVDQIRPGQMTLRSQCVAGVAQQEVLTFDPGYRVGIRIYMIIAVGEDAQIPARCLQGGQNCLQVS